MKLRDKQSEQTIAQPSKEKHKLRELFMHNNNMENLRNASFFLLCLRAAAELELIVLFGFLGPSDEAHSAQHVTCPP